MLARLLAALGHVLKDRGRRDRALALLERSTETYRQEFGEAHPDDAMSISILGDLLGDRGDLEEARRLHERALTVRREALGPDHPTVAWSLRSLGEPYH